MRRFAVVVTIVAQYGCGGSASPVGAADAAPLADAPLADGLAAGDAGAEGGPAGAVTLAASQAAPTGIVAYDVGAGGTRVVWSSSGTTGVAGIQDCLFGPGGASPPHAVESATNPHGLVGTASTLFWFDLAGTGVVQSLPVTCSPCAATTVADTAQPDVGGSIAADDTFVFFTDDAPAPNGHVYGGPVAGGQTALSSTAASPTALALEGVAHAVDWVEGTNIEQCPEAAAACTPTVLAALAGTAAPGAPSSLAAYKGVLYWTSPSDGALVSCTASSCAASLAVMASGLSQPFALAVDASGVYWVERGTLDPGCPASTGRVAMCPLAGCGAAAPTVLSAGEACPSAIATSSHAVAWSNAGQAGQATGAVRAVAKP